MTGTRLRRISAPLGLALAVWPETSPILLRQPDRELFPGDFVESTERADSAPAE